MSVATINLVIIFIAVAVAFGAAWHDYE